ncbi:OTU domain-containing protein 3-like [Argonauta hians]
MKRKETTKSDIPAKRRHRSASYGRASENSSTSLHSSSKVRDPPRDKSYLQLERILAKIERRIDFISGDGNCFFRALSKEISGVEKHHNSYRNQIVDLIETKPSQYAKFLDENESIEEHVDKMRINKVWATTAEVFAAAQFTGETIYLFTPVINKKYQWYHFRPLRPCKNDKSYILLCHTEGTHFDRVVPCDQFDNTDYPPPFSRGNFLKFF